MAEIFQYEFMRNAFIVGLLISIIIPCIGVVVVLKRLSMMGDTLSHISLAGVAAGLVAGVNPVAGAVTFSILASFGIEKIRKSFSQYAEISLAIIMAAGIGLAGILSGFVKNSSAFTSFLFGSIVAVSRFELLTVIILSVVVLFAFIFMYRDLFCITFDEESAKLAGIAVARVNFIFMLLTAIVISISARTIGTLVVSSLMIVPVASSMLISKSYKETVIYSIVFAVISTISGLIISFYADVKPGATIVLTGVIILLLVMLIKKVFYTLHIRRDISKQHNSQLE
ncbi:MAG TPA: metal ABC transporter permease [Clostridiales bacterium]|nr:metal ABC transporter permease [Clostridiales bacterium]